MKNISVLILIGSESDLSAMQETKNILDEFGVKAQLMIASAHRTPSRVISILEEANKSDVKVIIAGAGMAAHLAGSVAAHTNLPVIGVPLEGSSLNGFDALLSTVQMPAGMPVATMAIGKSGAKNAAILAVQILAISDKNFAEKLVNYRSNMKEKIVKASKKIES